MNRKEGLEYAESRQNVPELKGFYRLYKSIMSLDNMNLGEKVLFSMIVSYSSSKKEFYMSNNTLASATGLNITTIIRTIGSLRDKGYIKTYKAIDDKLGNILGRSIIPQKEYSVCELKRTWRNCKYIEYGNDNKKEKETT